MCSGHFFGRRKGERAAIVNSAGLGRGVHRNIHRTRHFCSCRELLKSVAYYSPWVLPQFRVQGNWRQLTSPKRATRHSPGNKRQPRRERSDSAAKSDDRQMLAAFGVAHLAQRATRLLRRPFIPAAAVTTCGPTDPFGPHWASCPERKAVLSPHGEPCKSDLRS